ncbi:ABC transporter substrate-binding protein [Methylobacterium oxalidis]|uniref:ABC transporter substrate-binding protein n=1 Tax=Methylobacterium oxalidis TaxID=944322 RepID=UPI0033150F17
MISRLPNRRAVLVGAATTAAAASQFLPAPALRAATSIRIGYVTPKSGPLAAFAEADNHILGGIREALKGGINGAPVEILVKDSQSNPNRAAEVARDLIVNGKVNLVVVASTPETVNPVSTQCEIEEVPCISTVAPWQSWFIGRQQNPADPKSWSGFDYTYHFFWGLEDVLAVFTSMWGQLATNKTVGGLFPNDGDGNAWGDRKVGFPPLLSRNGYRLTDPGRFQNLTDDFSAQIGAFKRAEAEILTGVVIPPDFTTFWNQAGQQGFRPKVASIGKALLFPVAVEALGARGHNLSTEVWWSPSHPFRSSLTGASASDLATGYVKATGRPWTQPIGFVHALFEVAADALRRTRDPGDRRALAEAVRDTRLSTIVGPLAFGDSSLPPPAARNVAKTPLVGGQWRNGDGSRFKLVITDNSAAREVPVGATMQPIA